MQGHKVIININEGFDYKWYGNIGIFLTNRLFRLAIQFPFWYRVCACLVELKQNKYRYGLRFTLTIEKNENNWIN